MEPFTSLDRHSRIDSSSPELPEPSLHTVQKQTYETIPTIPLIRTHENFSYHDSLSSIDLSRGLVTSRDETQRPTQPLPFNEISSPDMPTSPNGPTVQVAASSPTSVPSRRPNGILASAMAPAGTTFRRPYVPPSSQPITITIDSDDEGPQYRGGDSSGSDRASLKRNDIKTSVFIRKSQDRPTEKVPESPQPASGVNRFRDITASARYDPNEKSVPPARTQFEVDPRIRNPNLLNFRTITGPGAPKRSSDPMANAYSNVKRPRQTGPARAQPVINISDEEDITLEEIRDLNMRKKVNHLNNVFPQYSVRQCYDTLLLKNGNFNDAQDHILLMSEGNDKLASTIDHINLTGSEDELMRTPVQPSRPPQTIAKESKQQMSKPVQSIRQKWGSSQPPPKAVGTKTFSIFEEPKKGRKLVRGRKEMSPLPSVHKTSIGFGRASGDSDSDDADSGVHSDTEEVSFGARLLSFFNNCSSNDLVDTAAISSDIATHIISQRPFASLDRVEAVTIPDNGRSKSKRKPNAIGPKILEKCGEMLRSYEAVDFLVRKCESIAKPLAREMQAWGTKVQSSKNGELEIVSLKAVPASSHDSGIGTPVSDMEDDKTNGSRKAMTNYISQPLIMADGVQMKDYQIMGVNWLSLLYKKRLSGILADDMGLGKTIQVIAFFAWLLENGEKGPHLVVVPAATLENWLQEFQRFCPTLKVEPYYASNPQERLEIAAQIEENRDNINVLITTYTVAKAKDDFPWLKHFGFCCTVFDEGHYLKNADSQVASKLVKIESKFRLLLTGTPLQNNLKELISLLAFLQPSMFRDKKNELQAIFTHGVKTLDHNHEALLSAQRIARARSMLTPFILRRKKYQVLKDLPKKERRVEYCDLTLEQAEIYTHWIEKAREIRARRERGENVTDETTNILMRLRQAAIHPFLFRRLYPDQILPKIAKACLQVDMWRESNPDLIVTELQVYSDMEIHKLCEPHLPLQRFALNDKQYLCSGKVQKMLELLRKFISEGHRTLIFSQFVMVLDILELVLEREAIPYFRLDGTTKVAQRQDLIDEFCEEGNETPVFMLSTRAGGAGINLAKANKVIVFDSGFNPQDDVQAENRAHRIGQVKEVEVVRLVSRGTVEEQIYAMGAVKLRLDEEVAGAGSFEDDSVEQREVERKEEEGRRAVEELFWKKLDANRPDVERESLEKRNSGYIANVEEANKVMHDVGEGEPASRNVKRETALGKKQVDDDLEVEEESDRQVGLSLPARTRRRQPASKAASRGKVEVK